MVSSHNSYYTRKELEAASAKLEAREQKKNIPTLLQEAHELLKSMEQSGSGTVAAGLVSLGLERIIRQAKRH